MLSGVLLAMWMLNIELWWQVPKSAGPGGAVLSSECPLAASHLMQLAQAKVQIIQNLLSWFVGKRATVTLIPYSAYWIRTQGSEADTYVQELGADSGVQPPAGAAALKGCMHPVEILAAAYNLVPLRMGEAWSAHCLLHSWASWERKEGLQFLAAADKAW